jgi:tetratricopeptide (TPR) repeat protein
MKTYENDELGFKIDIPKQWLYPVRVASDSFVFYNTRSETMNIVVGPLQPERLLEFTENEFRQYVIRKGCTDLEFGRIHIGDKDHLWASYCIEPGKWAKKYMIVFGGIEYAITAICSDKNKLAENEIVWDTIVKSFRLCRWRQQDLAALDSTRSRIAGELYAKGYEAASKGHYSEACKLLKQCLNDDPHHILAHKELAFILKNTGDVSGALPHRLKVKQLDPSDKTNCFNLAGIYAMLGEKEKALQEIDELIKKEPCNSKFQKFKKIIMDYNP